MTVYHTDCRYFLGDRPCRFRRMCEGCPHYSPMGLRILLIKLASPGDVLRTTPLLPALKRAFPESHLTWVTRPDARELLEGLREIDRLLVLDTDALARLPAERFDIVICLDKEPAATGLAAQVAATDKRGFVMGPHGNLLPANRGAEYGYRLGLDDALKFRENQRSYQQVAFEAAGLPWADEDYRIELPDAARARAREIWAALGLRPEEKLVGLNIGASDAFAYKSWRVKGWAELAGAVQERLGARVCLLGGPRDRSRVESVAELAAGPVLDPGATPSLLEFAALMERCTAVVSGDTLALHLALALRRRVVAVFGSTAAQELELYGRGEKIVPEIDCHPCYKRSCDFTRTCVDVVSVEQVLGALVRVLEAPPM
jgi:heptosyltransferase-2